MPAAFLNIAKWSLLSASAILFSRDRFNTFPRLCQSAEGRPSFDPRHGRISPFRPLLMPPATASSIAVVICAGRTHRPFRASNSRDHRKIGSLTAMLIPRYQRTSPSGFHTPGQCRLLGPVKLEVTVDEPSVLPAACARVFTVTTKSSPVPAVPTASKRRLLSRAPERSLGSGDKGSRRPVGPRVPGLACWRFPGSSRSAGGNAGGGSGDCPV